MSPPCPVSTAENLENFGALPKDTLEGLKLKWINANHSLLNVSHNLMKKRFILKVKVFLK